MNAGKHSPETCLVLNDGCTSTQPTQSRFQICVFLTVSITIFTLHGLGCYKEQENVTQLTEDVPQQTLQGFSTSHTEAGIIKWVVVGDGATFLKEIVEVQQPTVQIFEEGELAITLTGDRGEIIQRSTDIQLFDNVVGVSSDGKLYTDELHWRNTNGKLYAPNESEIVREDSTLIGIELEADPALENMTMKKIRAKIYAKDENVDARGQ